VIQRFTPFQRGLDVYTQILFRFGLAYVIGEMRRTQRQIVLAIFFGCGGA